MFTVCCDVKMALIIVNQNDQTRLICVNNIYVKEVELKVGVSSRSSENNEKMTNKWKIGIKSDWMLIELFQINFML